MASAARDEHPSADERDGLKLVVQRRREHDRRVPHGVGHLGVARAVSPNGASGRSAVLDGRESHGIVLKLGRIALGRRVGEGLDQRRCLARQGEDDHAGVRGLRHVVRELLLQVGLGREARQRDLVERGLQPLQLRVLERRPVGRHHDQVDDREHPGHHQQERERQLAAHARERAHRSRKR